MDLYLKERMQIALDRDESRANTGVVDLSSQFKGIFDHNPDYPLSKFPGAAAMPTLT